MRRARMHTGRTTRQVFSDTDGNLSSKRAVMFLSFLIMIALTYASVFMDKEIQQFLFDGFLYIVVGSLFSVASEKFSKRFRKVRDWGGDDYGSYNYYSHTSVSYDEDPDGSEYHTNINRWDN